MTVQTWIEKAIEDREGAPFDRVRLVDQATDVISPELPEEVVMVAKPTKKRKGGPGRPPKKTIKEPMDEAPRRLSVKLKVSKPSKEDHPPKSMGWHKEVDSDGDTVGGWSDEEDGRFDRHSIQSSLTPLSKTPSPVPLRFAFLPRPRIVHHFARPRYRSPAAEPTMLPSSEAMHRMDSLDQTLPVPDDPDVQSPHNSPPPGDSSPANGQYYLPQNGDAYAQRKRKPMPKAKILRVPRPVVTPPQVPLSASHHHAHEPAWHPTPHHIPPQPHPHLIQPFSYGNYATTFSTSTIYPPTTYSLSSNPYLATAGFQNEAPHAMPNIEQPYPQNGPPPFSHSPISRNVPLDSPAEDQYLTPSWPQNLDLLSLAAAEARHSPSLDQPRAQEQFPQHQQRVMPKPVQQVQQLNVRGGEEMMVERRYLPDYM